jgi:hypothetical protein
MADERMVELLVLIGLTTVLAGCNASPADDHLEHHVPTHKPGSFAKAVEQLEIRNPFQPSGREAGDPEVQQAELLDIIRWLPELAAETDLRRADWDAVQQASLQLEQIAVSGRAAGAERTAASSRYREIVGNLRELLSRAGPDLSIAHDIESGE